MTHPITRTIARLAVAAVAVIAIGGTVSGAGDAATTCRTWHLRTTDMSAQHTWHPGDTTDVQPRDPWHPSDATGAIDGGRQDPFHPAGASGLRPQHAWSPTGATDGLPSHAWHPDGDRSDACPSSAR